MSRRCPKKHHLFLNWLKANRFRFPFEPQIKKTVRCTRGKFVGVTSSIRFSVCKSGVLIFVRWNGQHWGPIADFDVVEKHSEQGYFCSLCLPDEMAYYTTRAALWAEQVFEPFLEWCNEILATTQWLAIYDYGGSTEAKLQKDNKVEESPALQLLLKGLKLLGESQTAPREEKDVTQNIVQMIPLFKSGRSYL